MKICAQIDQLDECKWQKLLAQSSFASPFQTPEYYHFYNSLAQSSADVFAVEDDGKYLALVVVSLHQEQGVKAYLSRRGIVYGGVVLLDALQEPMQYLLSHLKAYYKKRLVYLEIRHNFDYALYLNSTESLGYQYVPWYNYVFRNISSDSFMNGMTKARQRQLKKSYRNHVSWREANSVADIQAFYTILSNLYSHKVRKPLPPYDFFKTLYERLLAQCLIVEKEGVIIGGVMCPIYQDHTLYELYICGEDRAYHNAHPSIMAMWAMAEYASEHGIKQIDLMGAGQPGKKSSVRDFKSRFGGELVEYGRLIYKFKPLIYTLASVYLKIKARL